MNNRLEQQITSQFIDVIGGQIALDQETVASGQAQVIDLQQLRTGQRFVGQQVRIAGQRRNIDLPDLGGLVIGGRSRALKGIGRVSHGFWRVGKSCQSPGGWHGRPKFYLLQQN